jgi:hypothetical protein
VLECVGRAAKAQFQQTQCPVGGCADDPHPAGLGQQIRALRRCPAAILVSAHRPDEGQTAHRNASVQAHFAGQLQSLLGIRLRCRRSASYRVGPREAIQHDGEHADSSAEPGLVGAAFVECARRIKFA